MSDLIYQFWGEGKDLTTIQVATRTVVMFFIAMVLLRAGGVRIFSRKSAFDEIIAIMLGAVLSRGIVGASPFGTVVISGMIMIALYRFTGWLTVKFKVFDKMVKNTSVTVFSDGEFKRDEMTKSMITEEDIKESLRLETKENDFDNVDEIRLETNGRISFVMKKKSND